MVMELSAVMLSSEIVVEDFPFARVVVLDLAIVPFERGRLVAPGKLCHFPAVKIRSD